MTTIQNAHSSACLGTLLSDPLEGHPQADAGNPTHASARMQGGQAVVENDNYRITAGDNNTVTIYNKHTGESYKAWGDPHMDVNGKRAFDFHGTLTLNLEDGTKVTIATTPDPSNPGQTLTTGVTVTNGDYGAQISGIDTNRRGDLKIDETHRWGKQLDRAVDDGTAVHENPAGKGFVGFDDNGRLRKVDQGYIDNKERPLADQNNPILDYCMRAFKELSNLISLQFTGHLPGVDAAQGGTQSSTGTVPVDATIVRRVPSGQAEGSSSAASSGTGSAPMWWDLAGIGPSQAEQAQRKPRDRARDPLDLF